LTKLIPIEAYSCHSTDKEGHSLLKLICKMNCESRTRQILVQLYFLFALKTPTSNLKH